MWVAPPGQQVKCRGDVFVHVGCTARVASVLRTFCACGLHRQGSMCVAVSYMCVVPLGEQVCCIPYKDIGISIVVIFLVSYIW